MALQHREVSGWTSSSPPELTAVFSTAANLRFCNWSGSGQRGRGGWGQAPAALFHQAVHGYACARREETAGSWSPSSGGRRYLERHPYSIHGLMRPQLHNVYDPPLPLFYCKIVRKPWPVITVSLLTKTQLMSSLTDVPDTGWPRNFIGVGWRHVAYCVMLYMVRWEEYYLPGVVFFLPMKRGSMHRRTEIYCETKDKALDPKYFSLNIRTLTLFLFIFFYSNPSTLNALLLLCHHTISD